MATANKLSIIPCGAMTADLTWLLLKRGRTLADRHHRGVPTPWVDVPSYCVLVETDAGTLLWDTACPPDWEERWAVTGLHDHFPYDHVTDEEMFDARLHQMGVELGDVDVVALSHLHFDHAGNLGLFAGTGAELICHEKEHEFAFGFDGAYRGGHIRADYDACTFRTVSGDTEVLPGVTLVEAPGHTMGTMAMQVDLPDTGTVVFTSDAVYLGENYGPPVWPAAFADDLDAFYSSVEKLRGIQERTDALMVFGHDAEQMRHLRLAPGESYT